MKRLICGVVAGAVMLLPSPTEAGSRLIIGELQTGYFDVSPPTRLDVNMWPHRLYGMSVKERCDQMGGRLGHEKWRGKTIKVCYDVDY